MDGEVALAGLGTKETGVAPQVQSLPSFTPGRRQHENAKLGLEKKM